MIDKRFQKVISKAMKKYIKDIIDNPKDKYEVYYSKCMKECSGVNDAMIGKGSD